MEQKAAIAAFSNEVRALYFGGLQCDSQTWQIWRWRRSRQTNRGRACDWLERPQGWKGGGWPMNCSQERRKLAVPSSAPRQVLLYQAIRGWQLVTSTRYETTYSSTLLLG